MPSNAKHLDVASRYVEAARRLGDSRQIKRRRWRVRWHRYLFRNASPVCVVARLGVRDGVPRFQDLPNKAKERLRRRTHHSH
jgi:hypothetical protein